jgi:hypothetical protein
MVLGVLGLAGRVSSLIGGEDDDADGCTRGVGETGRWRWVFGGRLSPHGYVGAVCSCSPLLGAFCGIETGKKCLLGLLLDDIGPSSP